MPHWFLSSACGAHLPTAESHFLAPLQYPRLAQRLLHPIFIGKPLLFLPEASAYSAFMAHTLWQMSAQNILEIKDQAFCPSFCL